MAASVRARGRQWASWKLLPRARRDWLFWFMATWLMALLVVSLAVQWLPLPPPNKVDLAHINSGVSGAHPFGTDYLGRDLLSRSLWSVRPSVGIAVLATSIAAIVGTGVGVIAGFFRGSIDELAKLVINVLLAFPSLILILALVTFMGPSIGLIVLIFALVGAPAFARVARGATIAVTAKEFVMADRALGMRRRTIVFREILPQVIPGILTFSLVIVGLAIVALAELSFIGAGLAPPRATWGGMINEARDYLDTAPAVIAPPGGTLFMTVLALNLVGSRLGGYEPRRGQEECE